jgi:hypothetical protein
MLPLKRLNHHFLADDSATKPVVGPPGRSGELYPEASRHEFCLRRTRLDDDASAGS